MTGGAVRIALGVAASLAYLAVLPAIFRDSPYVLGVLTTASVLSVIALGVWLTFAIGRINIGQGGFALIGGYAAAILSTRLDWSFWVCLPLAGLVAALCGALIGWPILRLKGVYFAMITLSLTEAVRLAALNGGDLTQGATGIVNVATPGALAPFGLVLVPDFASVNSHLAFFYLAAALLALALGTTWRIATSRLGWIFRSLRQNEDLAASIGINVAKYRVMAFAICAFFGGLGGAFFTVSQQSIYPSSFGVTDSIYFMLYCFFGGLTHVLGPVIGAFVLFLAFEILHDLRQYQMVIYAAIMISAMLWLPDGMLSVRLPGRWTAAWARRRGSRQVDRPA